MKLQFLAVYGLFGFGLSQIMKRFSRDIKHGNNKKKFSLSQYHETRRLEINMIKKRAEDNYNKELNVGGLVILEAYFGPYDLLDNLQNRPDKTRFLFQNSSKISDITVPLRFHVRNSRIDKFRSNVAIGLTGFHEKDGFGFLIIFSYQGVEGIRKFEGLRNISLP